ncbi:hypothetical protein F511_02108 [Dorcoceras hygrometricum]|nr:hypothetical protein F511_02108 [Dorcoceras hygrometricum]
MESSLISNTNQVYVASVLAMDNAGMVAMFKALVASCLNGFLGCLSDIYEAALFVFFQNASVRDGQVISTVQGKLVEILEEVFVRTFELPMERLMDLNEVPKYLVFDVRSVFSFNGEQLRTSCKKWEMKFEFRLLCDILVNWGRLLFNIFKDMVKPGSRQARGYAVQISILMKNVQNLELVDSKEFPPIKILTAKTVGRYIAINEKIGVDEVEDESRVKKTPAKKVASRKRPAAAVDEKVVKKKRTRVGKAAVVAKDSALLKRKAPKRKLKLPQGSEDEPVAKDADVGDVEKQSDEPTADEVDNIIAHVITATAHMDTVVEEPFSPVKTDRMFETGSESEDELEMFASKQPSHISKSENRVVESASAAYLVEEPIEETEQNQGKEITDAVSTADTKISGDESMTLEEHLSMILDGSSLPSTIVEVTKIQFGKSITIRGVDEGDWYKASLPKIPSAAKRKAPLQEKDPIKGNPAKEIFSLICADIELLVQLREQVIDDVDKFFNSFSFKRLAALKIEDIYANEELVLSWAEADSTRIALQRKMYILTKHFEGPNRDRGAVIARSNKNIRSSCWIRTMIRVDGSWVIEPCADYWNTLPRCLIRNEIFSSDCLCIYSSPFHFSILRSAVVSTRPVLGAANIFDTIVQLAPVPSLSDTTFDSDVQMDAIQSSDSSSSHDLMDIHVDTPVLFTTADDLQGTNTVFDQPLLISTAPTATVFTESFAQLRDSISQISIKQVRTQRSLDDLKSELLFKIDNLAKASAEARDQQTQYIHNSIKSVCQEARTQGDVLSVKLNEFQKGTRAHHALVTTKLSDIRNEIGFLLDYINRGGDAKNGEGGSSLPQPPPDDQSRPSGGSGSRGSGGDGSSQRRDSCGSSKKRHSSSSGGGGPIGPIRRDVEYWICGKRQF